MLTTIKGIYSNGQITLTEPAPITTTDTEVLVTFTENIPVATIPLKPRKAGFGKGTFTYMASDFNEPLDDLKDYM
ncbi:MAG: DUF2281 domain-containing protein [Flavobacterium sp.]|nr:DUF2281 domain-containing protein [Flavobacterium sp.]